MGRAVLQSPFLGNPIILPNPVLKETLSRLQLWRYTWAWPEGLQPDPRLRFGHAMTEYFFHHQNSPVHQEQHLGSPRTCQHRSDQASVSFANGTEAGSEVLEHPRVGSVGRCSSSVRIKQPKGCRNQIGKRKRKSWWGFIFKSCLKLLFGWTALWRGSHIPRVYNHLLGIPQSSSDNEVFQEGPWKCLSTIIFYRLMSQHQGFSTKHRTGKQGLGSLPYLPGTWLPGTRSPAATKEM